jgi:hypothetical protein
MMQDNKGTGRESVGVTEVLVHNGSPLGEGRCVVSHRGFGDRSRHVPLISTPLPRLDSARTATVSLLGHEHQGVPGHVLVDVGECVETPMIGVGAGRNVAVAGYLVAYRLAGLS